MIVPKWNTNYEFSLSFSFLGYSVYKKKNTRKLLVQKKKKREFEKFIAGENSISQQEEVVQWREQLREIRH